MRPGGDFLHAELAAGVAGRLPDCPAIQNQHHVGAGYALPLRVDDLAAERGFGRLSRHRRGESRREAAGRREARDARDARGKFEYTTHGKLLPFESCVVRRYTPAAGRRRCACALIWFPPVLPVATARRGVGPPCRAPFDSTPGDLRAGESHAGAWHPPGAAQIITENESQ